MEPRTSSNDWLEVLDAAPVTAITRAQRMRYQTIGSTCRRSRASKESARRAMTTAAPSMHETPSTVCAQPVAVARERAVSEDQTAGAVSPTRCRGSSKTVLMR